MHTLLCFLQDMLYMVFRYMHNFKLVIAQRMFKYSFQSGEHDRYSVISITKQTKSVKIKWLTTA